MTKTIRTMFLVIGAAAAFGVILGVLDLAAAQRGESTALQSYRSIQVGEPRNDTRATLAHFAGDCSRLAASSTAPSLVHCSDFWWNYSFYFRPQTGRLQSKRFSPRQQKPLVFRFIH